MMKRLVLAMVALTGGLVFAAVNGGATLLTIGTEGPDRYADGTTVLDGESYALVWRAPGSTFAGFAADGTVVDSVKSRVLCLVPFAERGRCPETTFAVDAKLLAACGNGGTFGLYLLDTRRWGADGKAVPAGSGAVHGSVLLSETDTIAVFTKAAKVAAGQFALSAVPSATPSPRITAIRMEGNVAVLTVEGTVGALNYNVAAGKTPAAADNGAAAAKPVAGSAQPIELRVPCDQAAPARFMKVVRNPLK